MSERSQMMNQAKLVKHKQPMAQMMSQPMQQLINQPLPMPQMLNQPPPLSQMMPIMNRSYVMWPQPQPQPQPMNPAMERLAFQNPFNVGKPPGLSRSNWKGKKGINNQNDLINRRNEQQKVPHNQGFTNVGGGGYQPPVLLDLQSQNRNKARKYYHPKKKFNDRFAPYAPRNTSSFIIRAKKSGGIASLVSPCPVTPAVLPTPVFSPSREVLGDIAKEEWGVDGYGSMKGLIRLRSPGSDPDGDEDEEEDGSSESDVEEHVEVERRLDHDLSRFEMVYPNGNSEYNNLLENRVDDQDTHIAQLEEENLTLKERLFLMEREMGELRKRLQNLERFANVPGYATEEVVENGSDNDAESNGRGEVRHISIGYNEDLEYIDVCIRDDHHYTKKNDKAITQCELENYNGLKPNNTITSELDCEEIEKKVDNDINMEEHIASLGQDSADEDLQVADSKYMSDSTAVEQALDDGDLKKEAIRDGNVKSIDVVGAENSEICMGQDGEPN